MEIKPTQDDDREITHHDKIALINGDELFREWLDKLLDLKKDLADFVASHRSGDATGKFEGFLKGSFNLGCVISFDDERPKAIIRFPKPDQTALELREEKVLNEVSFIELLREKTTIPVPHIWKLDPGIELPYRIRRANLGPFVIMDFVEGTLLGVLLEEPTKSEADPSILAKDVDDTKLSYVFELIADYLLQLSRLEFDAIGAISKSRSSPTPETSTLETSTLESLALSEWMVDDRPLRINLNELMTTVCNYTGREVSTFTSARAYLDFLADEHLVHFRTQRNLSRSTEKIKERFIARHRFKRLVEKFCIDDKGPFKPFCDDLRPSNMLADPETFRIACVFDWEFANAMPSQFTYDPPWWLILSQPGLWLEDGTMEEFETLYVPRMEQFLQALKKVEARNPPKPGSNEGVCLSDRMRESWASKRFWFNYGIRHSFDIDTIYWAAFGKDKEEAAEREVFLTENMARLDRLIKMKMSRFKMYRTDLVQTEIALENKRVKERAEAERLKTEIEKVWAERDAACAREDKVRQDMAREKKAREDKDSEDKAREEEEKDREVKAREEDTGAGDENTV